MRKSFWLGLVLLVIGLIVALSGPSYNDEVADFGAGGTEVSVRESEGVPSWLGWTAAGIGLVLMVTGLRGGRHETTTGTTFDDRRPHTP
jgi:hypothetical protein